MLMTMRYVCLCVFVKSLVSLKKVCNKLSLIKLESEQNLIISIFILLNTRSIYSRDVKVAREAFNCFFEVVHWNQLWMDSIGWNLFVCVFVFVNVSVCVWLIWFEQENVYHFSMDEAKTEATFFFDFFFIGHVLAANKVAGVPYGSPKNRKDLIVLQNIEMKETNRPRKGTTASGPRDIKWPRGTDPFFTIFDQFSAELVHCSPDFTHRNVISFSAVAFVFFLLRLDYFSY